MQRIFPCCIIIGQSLGRSRCSFVVRYGLSQWLLDYWVTNPGSSFLQLSSSVSLLALAWILSHPEKTGFYWLVLESVLARDWWKCFVTILCYNKKAWDVIGGLNQIMNKMMMMVSRWRCLFNGFFIGFRILDADWWTESWLLLAVIFWMFTDWLAFN